jgi:tetratricopeptide (TPR) repeat protein
MPKAVPAFLFAVLAFAPAAQSHSADASDNPFHSSTPYEDCVAAIDKKADDAFENALIWRDHGGGIAAEHCAALALIALDEPGEAASRLDALAQRGDAGSAAERAALLSQSGNAWLLADQAENAETAFSAALKITPGDSEIWIDRARAHAMRQDWVNAESDLTQALRLGNKKPETFVLRASARVAQGNQLGYQSDIEASLSIDPTFPDALVERGIIRLKKGDKAGARADWLQVLLRAPDGPAGDAARLHIEQLEVHDP